MPRQFIPKKIELMFLKVYANIMPMFFPNSQLIYRLSNFAKRGARFIESNGNYINDFITTNDIMSGFNGSLDNYIIDQKSGDISLFSKDLKSIYILRKKTKLEIIEIIQKAL